MSKPKQHHPYHLVDPSPWPLLGSLSLFSTLMGFIKWFHFTEIDLLIFSFITDLLVMYQWWRDIIRESTFQGHHTMKVVSGLRWGMSMFILSEIFFFLAFFWAFFHASLSPSIELGMNWPPKGIKPFDPLEIPLLNTLILLSSGLTITWSHHSIMEDNYYQSLRSLFFTVLLGVSFTALQVYEYIQAPFTIADGIYGSTFFMTTGLHGIHVIIGTTFLFVCFMRMYYCHFSCTHHFGFEAAAWYWHFVDAVWLILYMSIYWWGK